VIDSDLPKPDDESVADVLSRRDSKFDVPHTTGGEKLDVKLQKLGMDGVDTLRSSV